jgi:multiple sugar transport system ATP-binding protein
MARAIVREPAVFLFDEPLSNLDAKLRVQMRHEIRRIHNQISATSVFVTHDQAEGMTLADRLVVMNKGVIEQVGTPEEIYHAPASVYVGGFIGSPAMNLLPGVVRKEGGGPVVNVDGASLPLPDRPGLNEGRKVVFGIRPEHLDLTGAGGMQARVVVVEPTGSETHVVLRIGERDLTAVFRERHAFVPGQQVHLTPQPDLIHIFDADSGDRI